MISDKQQHTLDLIIGEKDGFTDNDVFEYKEFGNKFVNFFKNETNPSVVMLTGEWGSGKTIFRRQLAGECRNSGMDVLEFDAFESDYINDAFLAISSDLLTIDKTFETVKNQAIKVTKILANVGTAMAGLSVNTDSIIESIFNNRQKDKDTIQEFKQTLKQKAEQKKLVIMVDELDRCRPDFALSVLEVIKHFFNIPNIHFMIITNEIQLFSSIVHCYGGKKEQAEEYLEKFYDIRAELPFDKEQKQLQAQQYIVNFLHKHNVQCNKGIVAGRLAPLIIEQRMNLRQFAKHLRMASFVLAMTENWHVQYIPLLTVLLMLRISQYDIYIKLEQKYKTASQPFDLYAILDEKQKDFIPDEFNQIIINNRNDIHEMYNFIEKNYPL